LRQWCFPCRIATIGKIPKIAVKGSKLTEVMGNRNTE
jgi:hypothetical protein